MCSNYEPIKTTQSSWVEKAFNCMLPQADWKQHVYSYYMAPFVFIEDGHLRCELGHFGLIPPWVHSEERKAYAQKTYNARSETVAERNSYKSPWKHRKFGLVLADSFYEPLYDETGKNSKPTPIYRSDGEPTAIASIWESFIDINTREVVRSFSMLTVNADSHPLMSKFHEPGHEKRSVVVIENGDLKKWLTANHQQAQELIKLSPDDYLEADFSRSVSSQLSMF